MEKNPKSQKRQQPVQKAPGGAAVPRSVTGTVTGATRSRALHGGATRRGARGGGAVPRARGGAERGAGADVRAPRAY